MLVVRVPDAARTSHSSVSVGAILVQLGTAIVLGETVDLADLSAARCRAVVVDAGDRLDLARALLRDVHAWEPFRTVPSLLVLAENKVAELEPGAGFSDFILAPVAASELYARIRQLEWRVSEFSSEERLKVGRLLVDRGAHEVRLDGVPVSLTRKEYALLLFLLERRGRIFSREALLQSVWGFDYEGGERTIDIHVQRLRKKLGEVLPIETVRGVGYRVQDDALAPLARGGARAHTVIGEARGAS